MKAIFEKAVAQSRFSMNEVYQAVHERFFSQTKEVYGDKFAGNETFRHNYS